MPKSTEWDASNLAHRYTVSFYKFKYGDKPKFVTKTAARQNQEMNYFNIADPNNNTNAIICAGLLVDYMEAQGIPYHTDKTRHSCFKKLCTHLKKAEEKVLRTADIVDDHFKFSGEV